MFYEHKKYKTLFMSTKSYAEDVVYEHKMLFMSTDDAQRCCLWAQMMDKMSTRRCLWAQDVIYEHKKHKKQLFLL